MTSSKSAKLVVFLIAAVALAALPLLLQATGTTPGCASSMWPCCMCCWPWA